MYVAAEQVSLISKQSAGKVVLHLQAFDSINLQNSFSSIE